MNTHDIIHQRATRLIAYSIGVAVLFVLLGTVSATQSGRGFSEGYKLGWHASQAVLQQRELR